MMVYWARLVYGMVVQGYASQICIPHPIRIPKGDTLKFLNALIHIFKQRYRIYDIKDSYIRKVAVICLGRHLRDLMHQNYIDDEKRNTHRYEKRYRREGDYIITFLEKEDISPDSYYIERMNHRYYTIQYGMTTDATTHSSEWRQTPYSSLYRSPVWSAAIVF